MEEEIDIREYLKLFKRKFKLIAGIVFVSSFAAAMISLQLPNEYLSVALIQPATLFNRLSNQKVPVETSEQLEALFKSPMSFYLTEISKRLKSEDKTVNNLDILSGRFSIKDKHGFYLISGTGNSPESAQKLTRQVCSLIIERERELSRDILKIDEDSMNDIVQQFASTEGDIAELNKKIQSKEKTENLAQSYVFRALIVAREDMLKRRAELADNLRTKEIEIKFFTKSAFIASEASLPRIKESPHRAKIVAVVTLFGFIFSVIFVFVQDFLKK